MTFKSAALVSAMMLGAASAQATVYDFGTHAPLEISSFVTLGAGGVAPGPISDFYTFEIVGGLQSLTSSVVALNNETALSITGGQYGIFSVGANGTFESGGGDDSLLAGSPYAFNGTTGSTTHAVTVGPGKYYYAVGGTSAGSVGGYYTLSSTVSAVPEPQTYLLMLGGLTAVGFIAARRKAG